MTIRAIHFRAGFCGTRTRRVAVGITRREKRATHGG